jgi:hypothetical protein
MTDEERERLGSECEKIERDMVRDVMFDQPGWRARLDSGSDRGRREVMRTFLSRSSFERWCIIQDVISDSAILSRTCGRLS